MDSGNSGSLQSSSGNDDESYDSRAPAPIPSFPPNPPLFDPFPNPYFLNPALPWPRPDPDTTCFQTQNNNNISFNDAPPPQALPAAARNPKKRPRASRRAPTTVLTTDTTNFRAMVQEFTGVPAPPFQTKTKLDLFPGAPPYLRRPLPHRPLARTIKPANGTAPVSSGSSSNFTENSNVFDISRFQSSGHKFPFSGSNDAMGFGLDCHESGVGSNLVHDGAGDRDHQQQGVNGSVDSWICANSD